MAAITLTPVDSTTLPIVVNTDIIYHVFTINGVTRVFFSKGGKSPYQVDVQESAASIAAASPNLVEVTTVNGAEYVFIGSGAAGPGLGIMFIEANGTGSKITFKYNEESGTTTIYSTDSPSVISGRINALTPVPSGQFYSIVVPVSSAEFTTTYTNPVELIPAPPAGYATVITSGVIEVNYGSVFYDAQDVLIGPSSIVNSSMYQAFISNLIVSTNQTVVTSIGMNASSTYSIYVTDDPIVLWTNADFTQGDGTFKFYLNYQYIQL